MRTRRAEVGSNKKGSRRCYRRGGKAAKRADSEAEDIEDQETDKALGWLGAQWRSMVQGLRQRDSNIDRDDVY